MPQPEFKHENLCILVREAVFLERNRSPDIRFDVVLPDHDVKLRCDSRQISQALTNILKNASEAISARQPETDGRPVPGLVTVMVRRQSSDPGPEAIRLTVEDNGKGLPDENRDRLTEPYVTTHVKGTGLGLAIVKKIMEDHGADLIIEDRENGGARVSIVFHPLREAANPEEAWNAEPSTKPESEVVNVTPQFGTHG
jgi:two-component system nitrogen regulation sensor histidine kinase NtrY